MMDERDKIIIQKKYVHLVGTLETQNVLPYLYQEGVLSQHDKETINGPGTSLEKTGKLLDILKRRKDGLKMLIKALYFSKVQGFLANELLEVVTWKKEEMKSFKLELEGKIDPQQVLEANIAALKLEIHQLKEHMRVKEDGFTARLKMNDEEKKCLSVEIDELKANLAASKQENNQLKKEKDEMERYFAARLNKKDKMIRVLHESMKEGDIMQLFMFSGVDDVMTGTVELEGYPLESPKFHRLSRQRIGSI